MNNRERELRSHPDYADVYEDDLKALEEFREICGLGDFAEDMDTRTATTSRLDTTTRGGSSAVFSARNSLGSSVSSIRSKTSHTTASQLQSIQEEDSPDDDDASSEQDEEDARSTPSKRRKVLASQSGTPGSISTLGNSHFLGTEGTDDGDDSTVMS